MSERANEKLPYKTLGARLRKMRERLSESLAEVAGSVEIDIDVLLAIEEGKNRPAEEILLLLISHFGIKEEEATKLWELAGYHQKQLPLINMLSDHDDEAGKPAITVLPVDARINYTDMVHITVNNFGVVMNFMQRIGPNNQPLIVSRVGMSREHAKSVLEVLQQSLNQSEQKSLPPPIQEDAPDNTAQN